MKQDHMVGFETTRKMSYHLKYSGKHEMYLLQVLDAHHLNLMNVLILLCY